MVARSSSVICMRDYTGGSSSLVREIVRRQPFLARFLTIFRLDPYQNLTCVVYNTSEGLSEVSVLGPLHDFFHQTPRTRIRHRTGHGDSLSLLCAE